jgi:hypothetical protein
MCFFRNPVLISKLRQARLGDVEQLVKVFRFPYISAVCAVELVIQGFMLALVELSVAAKVFNSRNLSAFLAQVKNPSLLLQLNKAPASRPAMK